MHAAALGMFITAMMTISGGHLNPAVTLGFLSTGRIKAQEAGAYIAAQLVGAVLAAVLVRYSFPDPIVRTGTLGTPAIASSITFGQAIIFEAIGAFVLVSAVYGTIVAQEKPVLGGFGVGIALLAIILVVGPLTGATVNPARAFGPAVVSGTFTAQAVWWVGPILGALLAANLWDRVLLKKD
ncbi:MAG: aquaporin [Gemmatimonadetes bacterium]|nr:aquaporin [Gemmatimonadota bacterium]